MVSARLMRGCVPAGLRGWRMPRRGTGHRTGSRGPRVASGTMAAFAARIMPAFQLTRLSLVFGAVADAWFVILYTRGDARYNHAASVVTRLTVKLSSRSVAECSV